MIVETYSLSKETNDIIKKRLYDKYEVEYFYGENNIDSAFYYNNKSLLHKDTYVYNKDEHLIEIIERDSTNKLLWNHKMSLDSNANIVEKRDYNSTGKLKRKENYVYDLDGNQLIVNTYIPANMLFSRYTNKCNKNGDIVHSEVYKPNSSPNKTSFKKYIYEYDKRNNWIRKIEYFNSAPSKITERKIEYM